MNEWKAFVCGLCSGRRATSTDCIMPERHLQDMLLTIFPMACGTLEGEPCHPPSLALREPSTYFDSWITGIPLTGSEPMTLKCQASALTT